MPKLRQQTFIPSLSSATAEAKAWGHAIRIDPNYATAFYNRGSTYTELRDFDRAIQDFDQAIGLDPNLTKAFVNHDFLSATKSGYDRAVRDFDEAIRLDPNFAQAYLNRGIAKLRKGDSTGAPTSIERRCPILTSAIEISDLLMRRGLVQRDDEAAAALLAAGVALDRLDIYRNTIVTGLTKSLRLSFPAVERLVGGDFFDGAAQCFIASYPPREAYLDRYGSELPDFLRDFPPAASVPYLHDVARLEWAVNGALHAPDADPLDLAELARIYADDQARVSFVAHPSVRLLLADYPVDRIWRAVLDGDDGVLESLDINAGPVHLLVERRATGVEVVSLDEPAWRFLADLCAGRHLEEALDRAAGLDAAAALAEHLAAGRFAAFRLSVREPAPTSGPHMELAA